MNKKMLKVFGVILGVLAIVLAIVVYNLDVGYYENYETYGGDAYTGIQQAAAQTANNVVYVGQMIRTGFASILAIHGGVLLAGAFCIDTSKKEEIIVAPEQISSVE